MTTTQAAWFPFVNFDASAGAGIATGYCAYDSNNFYFAAKVADPTTDAGTVRMATRDDDAYFYPSVSHEADSDATLKWKLFGAKTTAKDDKAALQNLAGQPTRAYWENTDINRAFAFDLHLPQKAQVALYLAPYEVQNDVGVRVFVTDAQGKTLDERRIEKLWSGTYAIYNLSGDVRIRVRSEGGWFTAKVGGLFFDKPTSDAEGFVKN